MGPPVEAGESFLSALLRRASSSPRALRLPPSAMWWAMQLSCTIRFSCPIQAPRVRIFRAAAQDSSGSIQDILSLPDETRLFTGHDYQPAAVSKMGKHGWRTKRNNPHIAG